MKRTQQILYAIAAFLVLLKVLAAVENYCKDDLQAFFLSGFAGLLVICLSFLLYPFLVRTK